MKHPTALIFTVCALASLSLQASGNGSSFTDTGRLTVDIACLHFADTSPN